MALTKKKKDFANARLSGANKTQAAIAAGCPKNTASQSGSRFDKDPDVILYIKKKKNVKSDVKFDVKFKQAKKPDSDSSKKLTIAAVQNSIQPYDDPLEYLMSLVNSPDEGIDEKLRADCAKAALPYYHGKIIAKGKKEKAKNTAEEIASGGFFTPMAPPGKGRMQ